MRQLRGQLNQTLQHVADAVGLSLSGYQQIESGRKAVSALTATKIAQHFGVPVECLFVPKYYTARKGSVA